MITAIVGDNAYKTSQHLAKLLKEYKAGHGTLSLERIDCEEVSAEQILETVSSRSLFGEDKLVVLRNLVLNKSAVEQVEQIISSADESTHIIIYDQITDKRTHYYKILKALPNFYEYSSAGQSDLSKWLTGEAASMDAELSLADANYLIGRVGENQQLLASEIEKLATYSPKISREVIDLLTVEAPQSKIFDLLDAAFTGQRQKALDLYAEQRMQKTEPQEIIAMLAWQLRLLAAVKLGRGKTPEVIAKDFGLSPFPVSKASKLASKLSFDDIKQLLNELASLDKNAKISSIDTDEAIKTYIVTI